MSGLGGIVLYVFGLFVLYIIVRLGVKHGTLDAWRSRGGPQ